MKKKQKPVDIFHEHGGQLKMSQALRYGISRYMLYSLRDQGIIEQVSRGIYRLAELPSISNPDLVVVSLRFPQAVICLISALSFHDITTQIPHEVSVAVQKTSRIPSLDYPPVKAHKFSDMAYSAGIDEHLIDDVPVKVYNPEKTIADCFKFRNQIGMDIVLEALKLYRSRMDFSHKKILSYAKVCRVEKIIQPYLEAHL